MKKVLVLFVCVFVTTISVQAQTYFYSGNELVENMREYDKREQGSDANYWMVGAFLGYVVGVCDAMQFHLPDGVTRGQVTAVVSKYFKEHPELWANPAHRTVRQAIIEAFKLKQ